MITLYNDGRQIANGSFEILPDRKESEAQTQVNAAAPSPDRYIMRASTNNQYLPPGTIIQVFLFDDAGIQHEASIVNATYNNYQLEIQLTEPTTSRGGRVNWYLPQPRSMMSMPPLPTIDIPGMPTTRFKLR